MFLTLYIPISMHDCDGVTFHFKAFLLHPPSTHTMIKGITESAHHHVPFTINIHDQLLYACMGILYVYVHVASFV